MPTPTVADFLARRRQLTADPHRPRYHFTPPGDWLNDPNGMIQWDGRYHLFYQYTPDGPFSGDKHWGHVVSDDLLHWTDLPVAISPTPGGPDAGGCWSGCAVDVNGVPTFVYTGVSPQVVCLATGSSDLLSWHKPAANPVISGPPPELAEFTHGDFRDPYVWRQDDHWHLVIAIRGQGGGAVLHYQSDDLIQWRYQGVLLQGDRNQYEPFQSGFIWECPNFVRVGDRQVLLVSVVSNAGDGLYPVYFAGDWDGRQFAPQTAGILVYGAAHYAPQVMRLDDGRVLLIGWLREERPQAALNAAGWAGAMSLPLTLEVTPEGVVYLAPAKEVLALRGDGRRFESLHLTPGAAGLLPGVQGDALEVEAVFAPSANAVFGLSLGRSPDGAEQTRVRYDAAAQRLSVDPCGVTPAPPGAEREAPVSLDAAGRLHLRLFLDRSALEVFANTTTCLTSRLYPTRPDSLGLDLFCEAGEVEVVSLEVWTLAGTESLG